MGRTTTNATVPAGSYVALFQIYHKKSKGSNLGEMRVHANGKVVARKTLVSATFPNYIDGGYQRGTVNVSFPRPAKNVYLEFFDSGKHYPYLGVITLQRKGRPFFNIAHRMNRMDKVNQAIKDGANGIECDIHPWANIGAKIPNKNTAIKGFYVYHYGDVKYTAPADFDKYLANHKRHLDSGKLAMMILDIKPAFLAAAGLPPAVEAAASNYAKALVAKLKAHKIPANRVVCSVKESSAKAFLAAMKSAGYPVRVDGYYESGLSGKDRDLNVIGKFVDGLKNMGVTFAGMGKDSSVRGHWYLYAYWVAGMIKERDRTEAFKKVYFWTANTEYSFRELLDYGCDAILTDYPKNVNKVLRESPYRDIFRLATKQDSLDEVYGSK